MKDFFAPIYDWIIYNQNAPWIFQVLFNDGGYIKFGLTFLGISILASVFFYFVIKNPYLKKTHWLLMVGIVIVLVFGVTYGIANNEIFASSDPNLITALKNPESGYENIAKGLRLKYAALNASYGLIFISLFSLIIKRFSKIQMHLPI